MIESNDMEKPPDQNRMEYTLTKLSPGTAVCRFDDDNSVNNDGPMHKRLKTSTETQNLVALKGRSNENLLPLIDNKNICLECEHAINDDYVIRCSDCKRRFHGSCEKVVPKVRNSEVMPASSHLKYFNEHIMKHNGDFLGGRFFWVCTSCNILKETGNKTNAPDRYSILESLVIQNSKQYDSTISVLSDSLKSLTKKFNELSYQNTLHTSNKHNGNSTEVLRNTGTSGNTNDSNLSSIDVPDNSSAWFTNGLPTPPSKAFSSAEISQKKMDCPIAKNSGFPRKVNFEYKIKLFNKDNTTAVLEILKRLHKENKLECFDNFRSRGKSAIDIFFSSGLEAEKAYKKISDAFATEPDVECHKPEALNSQRTFFVGLSEDETADTILQKLMQRYPELQLSSLNKYAIKILEPKPCKNNTSVFRSTVFLSNALYEYISVNLNNRLRMGNYESWSVYPCLVNRCSKCQSLNHSSDNCKARTPVCAHCSESHWTRQCKNPEGAICCINCKRSETFSSNCNGHKANSSECPIYLSISRTKN